MFVELLLSSIWMWDVAWLAKQGVVKDIRRFYAAFWRKPIRDRIVFAEGIIGLLGAIQAKIITSQL